MQITKRILVAGAAALTLAAGGTAAFAASQDAPERDAAQLSAPRVTAQQAIEIALKEVPGSWVSEVDLDGRGKRADVWEVKTIKGDVEYELDIDATSGKLLKQESERVDDDD
ncbi:PepSY domain-containing protein [Nonomuraea sp. NPDC049649]|uniref:PepSY domain-containing protein n=1 Tax=Nonomuraea sp. NPDC049649 TaxID=3155776 RepID=UPI0034376E4C